MIVRYDQPMRRFVLSDVSLRLDETFEVGRVTKRILIKKGSVLELPQ